jgi:hypothetical protein
LLHELEQMSDKQGGLAYLEALAKGPGEARDDRAVDRQAMAVVALAVLGFYEYRFSGLRSAAGTGESTEIPAATVSGPANEFTSDGAGDLVDRGGASAVVASGAGSATSRAAGRATAVSYREADVPGPSSLRLLEVVTRHEGWLDVSEPPSARSIAASLAAVQAAQPEILRNLLSLSQRFDSQLVPDRRPVSEPLARISPASPERRSQLLAGAFPAAVAPAGVALPTSDRMVRRLSDDRFYEEAASRYRLGGGDYPSLSIKF